MLLNKRLLRVELGRLRLTLLVSRLLLLWLLHTILVLWSSCPIRRRSRPTPALVVAVLLCLHQDLLQLLRRHTLRAHALRNALRNVSTRARSRLLSTATAYCTSHGLSR